MAAVAFAQQPPVNAQQPPVKVNVLNVCAPSADERKELSSALAKVPGKPMFGPDYEVSRGHSTLDPSAPVFGAQPGMEPLPPGAVSAADWVRVRREFPGAALFSNVQYSFSVDAKNMVETLVLRVREPKSNSNDLMQISIEDSASAVATATAMSLPIRRFRASNWSASESRRWRWRGARAKKEARRQIRPRTNRSFTPPLRLWSAIATLWARAKWCLMNWLAWAWEVRSERKPVLAARRTSSQSRLVNCHPSLRSG